MNIPKEVIDKQNKKYTIIGIVVSPHNGEDDFQGTREYFLNNYEEYIDEKDLEIERLKKIIEDLKKPNAKITSFTAARWSQKDTDTLVKMTKSGRPDSEIAHILNRTVPAIFSRRYKLNRDKDQA